MKKRGRGRPAPPLSVERILAWADRQRRWTGWWPASRSGPVAGAAGESWAAIDKALAEGRRGLPGGDSVARLLRRARGVADRRGRRPGAARWRQAERLRGRGLTVAEIARRMRLSHQRVSQLLGRARAEREAGPDRPTKQRA
jgi:hypothetical protein